MLFAFEGIPRIGPPAPRTTVKTTAFARLWVSLNTPPAYARFEDYGGARVLAPDRLPRRCVDSGKNGQHTVLVSLPSRLSSTFGGWPRGVPLQKQILVSWVIMFIMSGTKIHLVS